MKPTRRHYVPPLAFRVVQPYGRDKAREATMMSEHATAAEAFAEIRPLANADGPDVSPNFENRGILDWSTATSCGLDAVACRTHGGSCSPL